MLYRDQRVRWLQEATQRQFDLIVIGGGITGAGVARDATLAGLSVALFDQQDFAAGTSSRSTKLFHGGLRYLERGEIRLVRHAGQERERMVALGPHLLHRTPMLFPVYRSARYGLSTVSAAVWVYDELAGVRAAERREVLSANAVVHAEPLVARPGLVGAIRYHEYLTDDARVTLSVLRSAVTLGARAISYAPVVGFLGDAGRILGVLVQDTDDPGHAPYPIRATLVVNAAGPWAEAVMGLDRRRTSGSPAPRLQQSRGIHIVVPWTQLPVKHAWSVPTPDHRLVFVLPHGAWTYVGTTDVPYTGDLHTPPIPPEEVQYLLDIVQRQFPAVALTPHDIVGMWAGVRPLIRQAGRTMQDISRQDQIWIAPTGLITIVGGKLTAWRRMAEDVMRTVYRALPTRNPTRAALTPWSRYVQQSRTYPLPGAGPLAQAYHQTPGSTAQRFAQEFSLTVADAAVLLDRYGDEAMTLASSGPAGQPIRPVPDLPIFEDEIAHWLTTEMALHLADIVIRRAGLGWFGGPLARHQVGALATHIARTTGWSTADIAHEIRRCRQDAYWDELERMHLHA